MHVADTQDLKTQTIKIKHTRISEIYYNYTCVQHMMKMQ